MINKPNDQSNADSDIVVLAASTLIYDPQASEYYANAEVHIADCVIRQLATQGSEQTEFARNAREALSSLAEQSQSENGSAKIVIDVEANADDSLQLAQLLRNRHVDRSVRLVTRDAGVRILAAAQGIAVSNHLPFGQYASGNPDNGIHKTTSLAAFESLLAVSTAGKTTTDTEGNQEGNQKETEYVPNELVVPESGLSDSAILQTDTDNRLKLAPLEPPLSGAEVWGIEARTEEQQFAIWLLMNPDIDLVSIGGDAGTGKTLLALAAGLEQTLEQRRFIEVIVTRATIAIGEDIGFLPGTEEEKMTPWMGAIEDNLEVLLPQNANAGSRNWGKAASRDLIGTRIRVKSINFMRGRTFSDRFIIIDEAQNLTPFQMKTLLTRAGPGTKVVLLGNLAQIDTPWLDPDTSGFSWAVARMRPWQHSGHVTLAGVERSRLARQAVLAL